MFKFEVKSNNKSQRMRIGVLSTEHCSIETPEIAIVATDAKLRSLPNDRLSDIPLKYLIVNTYHTYTKKIIPKIDSAGGIHAYMGLKDKLIATDSGGFQVFSLGFGRKHKIGKILPSKEQFAQIGKDDKENPIQITEEGVKFTLDGQDLKLNPEISMELQHKIGADIMMAFDECTSPLNSYEYTKTSMERTNRWLDRSISAHKSYEKKQSLFGIVQGGEYQDLREESAKVVGAKDVSGFGIGGSFGDFQEALGTTVGWVTSLLPPEKPRHLLGIGKIRDIFSAVEQGVDLFDCVIPTREARHRMLYTKKGRLYLRKLKHIDEPIDTHCTCRACRENITMKQLWEWFLQKDLRASTYTTLHNVQFYADMMREIRESIENGTFINLKNEYFLRY